MNSKNLQLDHLDTPRLAKDAAGTIHWRWDSDGYGSAAAAEDPDGNGKGTVINLRFPKLSGVRPQMQTPSSRGRPAQYSSTVASSFTTY